MHPTPGTKACHYCTRTIAPEIATRPDGRVIATWTCSVCWWDTSECLALAPAARPAPPPTPQAAAEAFAEFLLNHKEHKPRQVYWLLRSLNFAPLDAVRAVRAAGATTK